MRNIRILAALLAPWLVASPAYAGVQSGDTEVSIFGLISSDNEADTSTVVLGGAFGHFFTDNFEGKGSFTMAGTSDASGYGSTALFFGGGGDFLMGGAKATFVPYVGGLLNLTLITVDSTAGSADGVGATLDLHIGCKFFVTERASLDVQFRQVSGTVTLTDAAGNTADQDISNTDLLFGVNAYF